MSKNEQNFEPQKGFEPITASQMYQIENNGENIIGMRKLVMMENAGYKIFDFLVERFEKIDKMKVVCICGLGNNAGDAFVCLRHLAVHVESGFAGTNNNFTLILMGDPNQIKTEEASTNWKIIEKIGSVKKIFTASSNIEKIEEEIDNADIIIDGLFGTGIKGKIKDPYSSMIDLINRQKGRSFILAIDIPSGLNPDTGEITDKAVKANSTITFHRTKIGLLKNPEYSGEIVPVKIGIPVEAEIGVI
ncbi:MAG: NAD(P)H-hydrate epimerase [Thermoproteota archaeon]|nr:NAD(P)H-hydrate epimerase [Thermoproteota archaeon]